MDTGRGGGGEGSEEAARYFEGVQELIPWPVPEQLRSLDRSTGEGGVGGFVMISIKHGLWCQLVSNK
jgi:hypothetical protein